MNKDDLVPLLFMVDMGSKAQTFVADRTREDLDNETVLEYALAQAITLIGRAALDVDASVRHQNQKIPWMHFIEMKDNLEHTYFAVDLDRVWKTVTEEIPLLIAELEKIIPPETDTGEAR